MEVVDCTPYTVAKCGWVKRQTSVLHRWKDAWLVLYKSGKLVVYNSCNSSNIIHCINLPSECPQILRNYLGGLTPPHGRSENSLFGLKSSCKILHFSGENEDDALAWISSIEEFLEVERSGFPPSFTYVYRAPAYPPRAVNWLPIGFPVSYPRLRYGRYCDSLAAATLAGATAGLFLMWPWMLLY
ncbi:Pleckstrin homology domain-containing family B member 2 [Trichinella zimbabwensis]|uniref:Pleckstrin homology domain-containing family B member 2 n=2 Tax=Trichinella TaxID=6333 RepID=A0A0V1MHV3_9BILA|nr:Pleckstrin homology domain-containing family B member 2 [Trichinella zimbabwensis]KRZ71457.1 Pleckstrin homology domain-containing family B member 2 [Trichinella papuae]